MNEKYFSNQKAALSAIALLLALALGIFFQDVGNSFTIKWLKFDESLGHGYLIVAIVIYHLFKDAQTYDLAPEKNKHWLLIFVLLLLGLQIISAFLGILIFQQVGLYILWVTLIVYILGLNFCKKISFPVIYFLFAIPFWDFLNPVLLKITTIVATNIVELTSITVFIEENRIETPYGVIEIANGCSGLKFFEIGLALATYAVYSENMSRNARILIIIAGALLGIITNWIRVTLLIFIGYQSKMESSLMQDHETFGFILFFIVISTIIILIKKYRLPDAPAESTNSTLPGTSLGYKNKLLKFSLVTLCFLLFYPLNSVLSSEVQKVTKLPKSNLLVLNSNGNYIEKLSSVHFDGQTCQKVERTYQFNAVGKDVIPYNSIHDKTNYSIAKRRFHTIRINNKPIDTVRLDLKTFKNSAVLYYWYEYRDLNITNKYIAKIYELSYLFNSKERLELHAIVCK